MRRPTPPRPPSRGASCATASCASSPRRPAAPPPRRPAAPPPRRSATPSRRARAALLRRAEAHHSLGAAELAGEAVDEPVGKLA